MKATRPQLEREQEERMLRKLIYTSDDYALTLLRVVLGIVFFAHGAQKALGWFGGAGFSGTMSFFTGMGMPAVVAFLIICAEFLGGIGLIVGLLGRVAAFGVACVMLGAIFLVHLPNGFFMNWSGSQKGEGYEYHLLTLAMAGAILLRGSGAVSVDRSLTAPSARPLRS